jgi:hypothetical protein
MNVIFVNAIFVNAFLSVCMVGLYILLWCYAYLFISFKLNPQIHTASSLFHRCTKQHRFQMSNSEIKHGPHAPWKILLFAGHGVTASFDLTFAMTSRI